MSWLESIFDNNINYPVARNVTMERWHEFFFKAHEFEYHETEEVLKKNMLYPVDAYLNYWLDANKSAVDAIPPEQIMVLKTTDISHSHNEITDFLNIPNESIARNNKPANQTAEKHGILGQLDEDIVKQKIQTICGNFMEQHKLFE